MTHPDSFIINHSYELSISEQQQFAPDSCLASNNFIQQWRDPLLLWQAGAAQSPSETVVLAQLPLHPVPPCPEPAGASVTTPAPQGHYLEDYSLTVGLYITFTVFLLVYLGKNCFLLLLLIDAAYGF